MTRIIRLFLRSWYYFRMGYSTYISFAINMLNFATTTYYLVLNNVPFLKQFFPSYTYFVVVLALTLYPFSGFVGWLHLKGTPFFRVEQDIQTESNPYSTNKITPIMMPVWALWEQQLREKNMEYEADQIKEFLRNSK